MMTMNLTLEAALAGLRQEQDAWETRVVLRVGGRPAAPLVVFRRRGQPAPWVELGHDQRGADARRAFMSLGLVRKRWMGGAKSWGRELDPEAEPAVMHRTVQRLWDAVHPGETPDPVLVAQREPPPSNPDLLTAIRDAAERQDEVTRKALYAAIVNAQLLVPIDPATDQLPAAEQRPRPFDDDGGELSTWGAFSDWDALRQWQPGGHAFGAVHGAEFLAHVHDQGRCSVRINPDGLVGGELYPAEVQMMVEAVRSFYRSSMS